MRSLTGNAAVRAAALGLHVDAVTAEVVSRLHAAGIRAILLKGPSIALWLYSGGTPRPYRDTDLLVSPDALRSASQTLRELGFREQAGVVSQTWFRADDESVVDLHDRLFGADCPPEEQWAALTERTETMQVGGIDVEVLDLPPRTLFVVLHATQHGADEFGQPLRDLERALMQASDDCWEEATGLARRLRATAAFTTGLSLHPAGATRAESVDPHGLGPLIVSLHAEGAPDYVVTLERLASAPNSRARLRLLGRRLAPPPAYMRYRYPRLARRSAPGLALAYVWRPVSILPRLPAAVVAWRRTRRAARQRA